jgi:hypothetical protein
MRRSTEVPLTLLAALALFTTGPTGCQDTPESRNCVDAQGRIVPESNCQTHSSGGYGYHYLYGGSSGGHVGDAVVGGSTESGVSRGGFGHAGGEGGGEGGGGE